MSLHSRWQSAMGSLCLLGALASGCHSDGSDPANTRHVTAQAEAPGPKIGQELQGTGQACTTHTYFVATDGSDANVGTIDEPFATISHAIAQVDAGDTIYVRGGTYAISQSILLSTDGDEDEPIRLLAYQDEVPILDFASNPRHANPPQPRDDDSLAGTGDAVGLLVLGSWWRVEGLTVRNTPYYGVRVYGSHNRFEQLTIHDSKASGLEITGKDGYTPSYNVVSNSDSFHNFDPQSKGEDADGFAAKFDGLGPGNAFRRTRAWSNSDDGYDLWHGAYPITIEECWAFDNGFNRPEWAAQISGSFQGDGMGFKLGQQTSEIDLDRVVAFGNKGFGIDENGNGSIGGVVIRHATLVNNTKNGNPIQISLNDGSPHSVVNTLAFDVDGPGVTQISGPVNQPSNSWNSAVTVTAADFLSVDTPTLITQASAPRGLDGALPPIDLRLSATSDLIDSGLDLNRPYQGSGPDFGAFED